MEEGEEGGRGVTIVSLIFCERVEEGGTDNCFADFANFLRCKFSFRRGFDTKLLLFDAASKRICFEQRLPRLKAGPASHKNLIYKN